MFNGSKTLSIADTSDHKITREFKKRACARDIKIWFATLEAFASLKSPFLAIFPTSQFI